MACILQPECNFLHGYFRCCLPMEAVDIEVRVTPMPGTHVFGRGRTSQLIKCTPWSTRLCPHPTIIKKMQTFLGLEGKLGPKPQALRNQFRPFQPDTNSKLRKNGKAAEKGKRPTPTKRFKVVAWLNSNKMTAKSSNTKALTTLRIRRSRLRFHKTTPTIRRCPNPCRYPMAQSRENVRKLI